MYKILAITALSLALTGCSNAITDTSCSSFKAISWSKKDTLGTRREVIAHNRAYDSICR